MESCAAAKSHPPWNMNDERQRSDRHAQAKKGVARLDAYIFSERSIVELSCIFEVVDRAGTYRALIASCCEAEGEIMEDKA